MCNFLKIGLIASALFFLPTISRAQIYDLPCPAGSSPSPQSMQTTVPSTGHIRANTCVDANGIMTMQALGFAAGQTPVTGAIYASDSKYGAKFDGKVFFSNVNTCSWTIGTNSFSCIGANFTITDIGKLVSATINSCCGVSANYQGTLAFANAGTTITGITNSTTATISQNFTASSGANWIIGWGSNNDTALSLAENDWRTGNKCQVLVLPSGYGFVQQGHFTNPGTNCLGAEPQQDFTAQVIGQGKGATVIVPAPGFQTATCNGGPLTDVCFMGYLEAMAEAFQINGLGWGNTGFGSAKKLIALGLGGESIDLGCNAFGGSDANLIGFSYEGLGVRNVKMSIDGCGSTGALVNSGIAKCYYCFYGDTLGPNLRITSASDYTNFGDDYGITGGTVVIDQAGRYHGAGSNLFSCSNVANATAIYMANGANALTILEGARFNCPSVTSNGAFLNGAGQKLILTNGTVIGGTTAAINRSAGVVFIDPTVTFAAGLITSLAPTCAMTTGGGAGPTCSALAGSTNEKGIIRMTPGAGPGANGTTTITLAGTFSGASGTTPACFFDPANTGTGTWNLAADTQYQTASTTAPVFTWNNTIALTAASTYDVSYICIPR